VQNNYDDILERIQEEPKWWDEHGVPRYAVFTPGRAEVYVDECCLLRITCQNCGTDFDVCLSRSRHDPPSLAELIETRVLAYGDPPNSGCCNAGSTMSAVPRRVLQYWNRVRGDWLRDERLEKDVLPVWASDWAH
jgi:hypothetical protein